MAEPWWNGRALDQSTHERINASNYPGTRQLCAICDEPTGKCEDDGNYAGDIGPLCDACLDKHKCPVCEELPQFCGCAKKEIPS